MSDRCRICQNIIAELEKYAILLIKNDYEKNKKEFMV